MPRRGLSLIEVVIAIGLIVMIFGAIYLAFFSILDVITNSDLRAAAAEVINQQIEIIRNLPYDQIGTVSGIPSGIIPQSQYVSSTAGPQFLVKTIILNIDDPFDGILGGVPNDTAPADYKKIDIEIDCPGCARFVPLHLTTTAAPKNLESASTNGSLFVNVFDANAKGVGGASVHVVNAAVVPAIDLIDTTNASGVLQLVGVPTSTQGYHVDVSLPNYSSDRTYPPGGAGNPNPTTPDVTIVAQTLTQISFAIDRLSTLLVKTVNNVCGAVSSQNFSVNGTKLIGTGPDVLKFSTSSVTDLNGQKTLSKMEWDSYAFALNASSDILGTIPLTPFSLNPSSSATFFFVLQTANPDSLLVTVKDAANGTPIPNALVSLTKSGFAQDLTTSHGFVLDTNWAAGKYASQDWGIDADSSPGSLSMKSVGGVYSTSSPAWLISNTIDFGGASTTLYNLSWNPTSQPAMAGADSLEFQLAANNDNATWNFAGPDGTSVTYYNASGSIWSGLNGNRYLRYKAYFKTADETATPALDDVTLEFNSVCVPLGQTLFNNLNAGSYNVDVTASGYNSGSSTMSVNGAWQQLDIPMVAQ